MLPIDLPLPSYGPLPLTKSQKAKARRKKRIAEIRERPDSDNYKLIHYLHCGNRCQTKSRKLEAQSKWWLEQSISHHEGQDGAYYQRYLSLFHAAEENKKKSQLFYKLAKEK